MKKIIICSALLFAFFSCSKEPATQTTPSTNQSNGTAIEFNSSINQNIVRGTPVEGTKLHEDFGVFGYCDPDKNPNVDQAMSCLDPDFMYNQKVDYSSIFHLFSYSPICYWPTKGWIDFFAYAPYNHSMSEFCNPKDKHDVGYPVIEYKVKSVVKDQKDLMVGEALKQMGTSNCVNFDFKHALTKVGVEAHLDSNCGIEYSVIITKVEFKDIKDCGKFRYAYLHESDHKKWWSDVEGSENYHIGVCNDPYGLHDDIDPYWVINRPKGVLVKKYDGECYTRVNEYNQYLLAIPQDFERNCRAELCVTYCIYNNFTCHAEYYTAELPLRETQCWEPGCCIDYVICIELNAVKFEACVTPWKECEEIGELVNPADC